MIEALKGHRKIHSLQGRAGFTEIHIEARLVDRENDIQSNIEADKLGFGQAERRQFRDYERR